MSEGPAETKPGHDVYTVLLIVATVVVGGATIYLAVRSQQLFGDWNPFSVTSAA
ncbi:MAG: hypothetical protein ACE5HE_09510 [Phycisphaerae bacterium]